MKQYREEYIAPRDLAALAPGTLVDDTDAPVPSDSTLFCVCSQANAAKGECHRVWAAKLLSTAGWTVVRDGEPLAPLES